MGKNYNSMHFSREDVKNNLHLDLLNTLYKISLSCEGDIIHIHTYTEEGAVIVEWCQHNYDMDDISVNTFSYIDYDECVMMEGRFPDNHYEYFHSEEEYNEVLSEWLKEHPTYKQNQWSQWYDEEWQQAFNSYVESLKTKEGNKDESCDED